MSGYEEVAQDSHEKTARSDDLSDFWVVGWFCWSIVLVVSMWQFISHQNFLFIWVASSFVALIVALVEAVVIGKPQKDTKKEDVTDNQAWKVHFGLLEVAFSLLGPSALLAYAMWFLGYLLKLTKRFTNHAVART